MLRERSSRSFAVASHFVEDFLGGGCCCVSIVGFDGWSYPSSAGLLSNYGFV